jgi:hypothetical protein
MEEERFGMSIILHALSYSNSSKSLGHNLQIHRSHRRSAVDITYNLAHATLASRNGMG